MKKKKITAIAITVIAAMLCLSGCSTYDSFKAAFFEDAIEKDTIKIGVLEPTTGADSSFGKEEIIGIELAMEKVPQALGKDIELIYEDTQSTMQGAETAVEDLIAKEPAIVLGSYGEAVTLTASTMLKKAKIPAIAITSTNPLITDNNNYYFRVAVADDTQGKALAQFVYEFMGEKKATIVRVAGDESNNEEVNGFSKRLVRRTKNSNCITNTVEIDPNAKDYDQYALEIANEGNKAVFMPVSMTVADKIFESMVKQKVFEGMRFIVPKEWHTDDIFALTQKYPSIKLAVASDLVVNNSDEQTAMNEAFVEAYMTKTLKEQPSEAAALAYDAYMVAVQAIEKAASADHDAIRDAISASEGFRGLSGDISFDDSGAPRKTTSIDAVVDGAFVTMFTVE